MPTQDVRKYRNAKWFENFTAQIAKTNVKDPIRIYKPDDFDQHGEYELIDGHTRLLAARILKLKEIPALVVDKPKDSAYMESGYLNAWQQDLDPISYAHYAEQVVHKHMFDFNKAAEELGITERHIRNLLKLLGLPEDEKRQIALGERPVFPEAHKISPERNRFTQRKKKGGFGQRCLICGRWPEEGNRKWILLCSEHEDEINAIMDYILGKGWRHT